MATTQAPEEKAHYPLTYVGEQVRELRKARHVTISQLAAHIGRSSGYVSQVERGLSSVSIQTLQKISEALGVQINWFFQGNAVSNPDERGYVVRKDCRRQLDLSRAGAIEELLSPNLGGDLELILSTFEPGSSSGAEASYRDSEEIGMLISGELELWIRDRRFQLAEGDSFRIGRSDTFRWANTGSVSTVVVWAITPAVY